MFIAKITLTRPIGGVSTYAVRGNKFVDWKYMFQSTLFTTRQKARIAAKRCAPKSPFRSIQIYEVTPDVEEEMLIAKLRGY